MEEVEDVTVPAAPTPTVSIPIPSWKEKRERQKETNRARNRLFSIDRDVTNFILPLHQQTKQHGEQYSKQHSDNNQHSPIASWPWLANERCGCWYALPVTKQSCYFKSVDGHVNTWNMSSKRLNLQLVSMLKKTGGCFILDASRTKVFPDSLARTIPLWAAVMNRMVLRFRQEERGVETPLTENEWDIDLHTPYTISSEEHATMSSILDARVQELYDSGVLLQPDQLVANVTKPLRPVWITAQDMAAATVNATETAGSSSLSSLFESWAGLAKDYHIIVCVSCSTIAAPLARSEQQPQDDDDDDDANANTKDSMNNFVYSPGAGDDEECWARGLSPALFWKHRQKILSTQTCNDADAVMDCLVTTATNKTSAAAATGAAHDDEEGQNDASLADALGCMGVHVGSRRAGRPPDCWKVFDAVLNVTEQEYESLANTDASGIPENKYYLQLPVEEGKRDKHELERWLTVGIVFAVHHAAQGRKVLIHCAQGKDRSVAVAMAMVALFGDPKSNELCFRSEIDRFVSWTTQSPNIIDAENPAHGRSGMTKEFVESLLGRSGRDILFQKFKEIFNDQEKLSIVSKQSLRITLHSIQRYRIKASPTRSTMQKLNRFFLSSSYQEEREKDDSYHGVKRSREPPIA